MAAVALFPLASVALAAPPQQVLERKFAFPPPVEWKSNNWQVSVVELAWGPANSPEMISRGSAEPGREKTTLFPDRPYTLAIKLRGFVPGPRSISITRIGGGSGLVQVKDVNGDLQFPLTLTPTGFAVHALDLTFIRSNTTESWDFFPVSPQQRAFLFQVSSSPGTSFRVLIGKDHLTLVNTSLPGRNACNDFDRSFAGAIGAGVGLQLQLAKRGTKLSGEEQYTKIGKTLWLTGLADSFGNFTLGEEYPKDHLTGVFKGAFSSGCRSMEGLFSKPDGSSLLPFKFQQIDTSR